MFSCVCVFTVACIRIALILMCWLLSSRNSRLGDYKKMCFFYSRTIDTHAHVSESLNAIYQQIANSIFVFLPLFIFLLLFFPSPMHRDAYKLSKIKYYYTHCRKHFTYRVQNTHELKLIPKIAWNYSTLICLFNLVFHHRSFNFG